MSDEVDQLLTLLNAHRRTTGIALVQRALAGTVHVAPSVEATISQGRIAIKNVKEALRSRSYEVEDVPIIDEANDMHVVSPEEVKNLQDQIKTLTNQTLVDNSHKYSNNKLFLAMLIIVILLSGLLAWLIYDRIRILSIITENNADTSLQATNLAIKNTELSVSHVSQTAQTTRFTDLQSTLTAIESQATSTSSTPNTVNNLYSQIDFEHGFAANEWKLYRSKCGEKCRDTVEERIELQGGLTIKNYGLTGKNSLGFQAELLPGQNQVYQIEYCPKAQANTSTIIANVYIPEATPRPMEFDLWVRPANYNGGSQGRIHSIRNAEWQRIIFDLREHRDDKDKPFSEQPIECITFNFLLAGIASNTSQNVTFYIDDIELYKPNL
jgi:hypothetical protein